MAPAYIYGLAVGYCVLVLALALAVGAHMDRKIVYYL